MWCTRARIHPAALLDFQAFAAGPAARGERGHTMQLWRSVVAPSEQSWFKTEWDPPMRAASCRWMRRGPLSRAHEFRSCSRIMLPGSCATWGEPEACGFTGRPGVGQEGQDSWRKLAKRASGKFPAQATALPLSQLQTGTLRAVCIFGAAAPLRRMPRPFVCLYVGSLAPWPSFLSRQGTLGSGHWRLLGRNVRPDGVGTMGCRTTQNSPSSAAACGGQGLANA